MGEYRVSGGIPLCGEVRLQTSKNALLPMLAAGVLCEDRVVFRDVPEISDVFWMLEILRSGGATVVRSGRDVTVDYTGFRGDPVSENAEKLRASVFFLGALAGRFHRAEVRSPGGCRIGKRPIDLHLDGFLKMGCGVREGETIGVFAKKLTGARIALKIPSVGATENLMIAAVKARGTTVITGAAKEPEVVDLARFLRALGASVSGEGTEVVVIHGRKKLHGTDFAAMKDRIEGGTFLTVFAVSGGEGEIIGIKKQDLASVLDIFSQSACKIHCKDDKIYIVSGKGAGRPSLVTTGPFPLFPTDMQSVVLPLLLMGSGKTLVRETLFENRYLCAGELKKLGAEISREKDGIVLGASHLSGGTVCATDLRCGAALTVAALGTDAEIVIKNTEYIRRGYESFTEKIRSVGGRIREVP